MVEIVKVKDLPIVIWRRPGKGVDGWDSVSGQKWIGDGGNPNLDVNEELSLSFRF